MLVNFKINRYGKEGVFNEKGKWGPLDPTKTDTQYALDQFMITQNRINRKYDDSKTDLDLLLDGEMDHWGQLDKDQKPKKIKVRDFLGVDRVNELYANLEVGKAAAFEVRKANYKTTMQQVLVDIQDNGRDSTYIQSQYNKFKSSPYSDPQLLRVFERMSKSNQSSKDFNQYNDKYMPLFENGTIDKHIDEIKAIPNNQARAKYLKPAELIKSWKKGNKSFHENGVELSYEYVNKNAAYKDGTLTDADANYAGSILNDFINKDISERILNQYDREKGWTLKAYNPHILKEHQAAVQAFKDNNDWDVEGGSGIFGYEAKTAGKRTLPHLRSGTIKYVKPVYTHAGATNNDIREAEYNNKVLQMGNYNERSKIPGGIYTKDQIAGWKGYGYPSQDMYYIRHREARPMTELINKSIEAWQIEAKTNEDTKAWLEKVGLLDYDTKREKGEARLNTALQEEIKAKAGTSRSVRLRLIQSKLKHGGWETLHPEDIKLLLSLDYETAYQGTLDRKEFEDTSFI